ncbi:hypothetical protein HL658_03705 [Azospirillum sp. RWY-5-1]|uniref:Uncharacterized protein n=1 Tax=Azospirillum oleiclasticum TaxID=2735135 RepID=A0ABX2T3M1_9PROT|nr:hypothetical protein [Azospirillum oleiclasticum]NYZ11643.1 hypothetical protein [Azospirillum oleiclasticum]NYZ18804.1 hypothetical protein [Azospirillum oleiclasticum]
MAVQHFAPRRMGVYEGGGTMRSQSTTVIGVVAAVIVVALIAVLVI